MYGLQPCWHKSQKRQVLDEPTTYLDISHQLETMNLVKKLTRETGIGVVMVLHDLAQAMDVGDRSDCDSKWRKIWRRRAAGCDHIKDDEGCLSGRM